MSSKEWFVIHDGHHIGPFSLLEIEQMISNGHLHENQLSWKSGMSKWVTLKSLLAQASLADQAPPSLPPIPEALPPLPVPETEIIEEEVIIEKVIEANEGEDEPPPPIPEFDITPMEKMKLEITKIQNKEIFEEVEGEQEKNKEDKEIESNGFEPRLILAMALVVFIFLGTYFIYGELFPEKKGFAGLNPAQRKTLARVFDQPLDKKLYFRYALAKKGDGLWIASNYRDKARLKVTLESVKGQVLGEGPIKLSANAVLDGGYAYIKKWKIDKGFQAPYGKYVITIVGEGKSNQKWYLKLFPFLKKNIKGIRIEERGSQFLFFPGEIGKFEQDLKNYQYKVKKNIIGPLNEQIQRYKSFVGMLNQISSLYKENLNKARRGKEMEIFEKEYNRDIGPLLRDLILDCNRKHLSFFNVDPKRAKVYDELVQYGKEVGEVAAIIAKETTSYKKLRKKHREFLFKKYDQKIESIHQKGQGIILGLTEKLNRLQ